MATAYLFCGLPGSGKTTLAQDLERKLNAVRFTLDRRMLKQHDLTIFDEQYGELARIEKESIWIEALSVLDEERDVILDWSLWSRRARAEWTERIVSVGHRYKLFVFQIPLGVLKQRLIRRNNDTASLAHIIPLDELERFSHVFEVPTPDERLAIEIITSAG